MLELGSGPRLGWLQEQAFHCFYKELWRASSTGFELREVRRLAQDQAGPSGSGLEHGPLSDWWEEACTQALFLLQPPLLSLLSAFFLHDSSWSAYSFLYNCPCDFPSSWPFFFLKNSCTFPLPFSVFTISENWEQIPVSLIPSQPEAWPLCPLFLTPMVLNVCQPACPHSLFPGVPVYMLVFPAVSRL